MSGQNPINPTRTAPGSRRLLLSSLLESPAACGWILGAGALHVALAATPLGGWQCPFHQATGWPCPGCGLGRASVLLLRGDVGASLRLHAFAGVMFLVLGVLAAGLWPGRLGAKVRTGVRHLEEKTCLVQTALVALLIYWFVRLALDVTGISKLVL